MEEASGVPMGPHKVGGRGRDQQGSLEYASRRWASGACGGDRSVTRVSRRQEICDGGNLIRREEGRDEEGTEA